MSPEKDQYKYKYEAAVKSVDNIHFNTTSALVTSFENGKTRQIRQDSQREILTFNYKILCDLNTDNLKNIPRQLNNVTSMPENNEDKLQPGRNLKIHADKSVDWFLKPFKQAIIITPQKPRPSS